MCGFAGFICFKEQKLDKDARLKILKDMGRLLAPRGPDDEQFYDDSVLSLVFRRLSIVDIGGGQQPIWNADQSKFVVVNGELYNHKEIRQALAHNYTFSTESDSEALLHLFEDLEQGALERINGMFAAALWDIKAKRLFLARDRLGIKPLYYCRIQSGLLFGSELKALLAHPDCPRQIRWSDLGVIGPQQFSRVPSYVEGIEHLPGGHYLFFSERQGAQIKPYWSLNDNLLNQKANDSVARDYQELFQDSVEKRLMSDVPVGIFLSGGVDSALIAAEAAKHTSNLHCFTVVERATYLAGDVEQANKMAAKFDVPHHPVLFDLDTFLDDISFDLKRFEHLVFMMDSPRFDAEWLFKQELHRYARNAVPELKVILLGQGADEFAGGYSNRLGTNYQNWNGYINTEISPELRQNALQENQFPNHLSDLANIDRLDILPATVSPYHRQMNRLLYQLQHFNLWHEDRSSSSQSIESRVPFLDHRLVELLASIPADQHAKLFWDKQIVREMIPGLLPGYPTDKRKVAFFVTDDTHSIDEFALNLAIRTYPQFREKYSSSSSSVFSFDSLDKVYANLSNRTGPHIVDHWRLLECMSISIFDEICQNIHNFDFCDLSDQPSSLRIVDDWPCIAKKFSVPQKGGYTEWTIESKLHNPTESEVLTDLSPQEAQRCILLKGGRIYSEISLPKQFGWILNLLRNVDTEMTSEFTLQDWADEFDLEFEELLDPVQTLVKAGFLDVEL